MNLYRSFGCLLETWVTDGYPVTRSTSTEGLEKNSYSNGSDSASADSLRLTGVALRSESEDSGVELPSVLSPMTSQHRVLTSQTSQLIEDDLRPSSSSPALSHCSSSSSCFSATRKGSLKAPGTAGLKVEEALRRTEPAWRRSVDSSLRRRCNTTSISSGSITPFIRSRVGSVGPGRPYTQAADEQRVSEVTPRLTHTPQLPVISNIEPAKQAAGSTGPEWEQLPPGFLYLEQMCRMLEEISRLQKENRDLHLVIKNSQDRMEETEMKADSKQKADITSTDCEKLDLQDAEDQPGPFSEAFFRRRSVSDTWTFNRHRKSKAPRAEHFPSTDVLLEEPESPKPVTAQPVETEQRKASNSLKEKISSLRWNEKSKSAKSSSSSNEKKRIFGQLFRNRRKTTRF
ncbi:uncharacterized protein si:dkey-106l3.7 isoform X1 [Silurus meridionalis]|uniref:DUF4657 domain-containing protein n=1 Tax=Silurus meridionalis TaxID=175797 RepID=A0A8T0B325_SILME|nr:uncharacterized protein si:dkey-106l3.7 isoform X1 [Silurus meridionalis]KAF7700818.1 hypothetical protein HF521_001983 [Silurus meridionalis]